MAGRTGMTLTGATDIRPIVGSLTCTCCLFRCALAMRQYAHIVSCPFGVRGAVCKALW